MILVPVLLIHFNIQNNFMFTLILINTDIIK